MDRQLCRAACGSKQREGGAAGGGRGGGKAAAARRTLELLLVETVGYVPAGQRCRGATSQWASAEAGRMALGRHAWRTACSPQVHHFARLRAAGAGAVIGLQPQLVGGGLRLSLGHSAAGGQNPRVWAVDRPCKPPEIAGKAQGRRAGSGGWPFQNRAAWQSTGRGLTPRGRITCEGLGASHSTACKGGTPAGVSVNFLHPGAESAAAAAAAAVRRRCGACPPDEERIHKLLMPKTH